MAGDDLRANVAELRSSLDAARRENETLRRRLEELTRRLELQSVAARILEHPRVEAAGPPAWREASRRRGVR